MTVNPSTMRLGIAAILIGLVGAYGVRVMMDEEEAAPKEVVVTKFLVPLAGQDLSAGRVVHKGDITLRQMDAEMMKQESMPLDLVMMSADQIIGRQLRKPLRLGEPFLTNALYPEDAGPGYELKSGYRAVSVNVAMGRGGYAKVNDVVDVFFTSFPKKPDHETGQGLIPQKTILVTDAVTVLEVTRPQAPRGTSRYVPGDPSFLIQVLPDQVARYQALRSYGEFSFMIRSGDDVAVAKNADPDGMTIEEALGIEREPPPQPQPMWVTQYYKGGSFGAQQFPIPPPSPEQIAEYQRQLAEQQAREAAGDDTVADASPTDDAQPAPAPPLRRRPTLREPKVPSATTGQGRAPQVPYREPPTATPLPRTAPPPSGNSAGADAGNPFGDDEVLP